jgi:hypothetical protein
MPIAIRGLGFVNIAIAPLASTVLKVSDSLIYCAGTIEDWDAASRFTAC